MNFTSFFKNMERIAELKRTARIHYEAHAMIADRYGCGFTLVGHINPDIGRHAEAFNKAMEELSEIDPHCPKWERL